MSQKICFKINGEQNKIVKWHKFHKRSLFFKNLLLTHCFMNSPAITKKKIIPNWAVVISRLLDFFRNDDDVRRYFTLNSRVGE